MHIFSSSTQQIQQMLCVKIYLLMRVKLQYALIWVCLVAGAANTLCFTLQNKQPIVEYGVSKKFFHPYMQGAMRFVSNSFIIFVALALKRKFRENNDKKVNPIHYVLCASLDVLFSFCYYTALNFIPSSVYQMLRGGTLIFTYIFGICVLKTKLMRQKLMGCGVIIVGLAIVGISSYVLTPQTGDQNMVIAGYGLIIFGIVLTGMHYVYQQYMIVEYGLDPLWLLGIEALISIVLCALVIPFLSLAKCPFQNSACVIDSSGQPVVESIKSYMVDIFNYGILTLGVTLLLISMVTYNAVGLVIVKKMTAMVRAVVDISRTLLIWLVGILLTATAGTTSTTYQWESLQWKTVLAQSLGFFLLVCGNFIFYQIVEFDCLKEKTPILDQADIKAKGVPVAQIQSEQEIRAENKA